MKKNNIIFIVSNALLIVVLGAIIGLTCGNHIFSEPAGTSAFVCCLVTLGLPSALYFMRKSMTTGGIIGTVLFLVLEFVINVVFIIKPDFGIRPFWIIQAVLIALFLVTLLAIVALFKEEVSENKY